MTEYGDWDDESNDYDDEAETPTLPCPFCHEEIYEAADCCPYCGNYISLEELEEDNTARFPVWVVMTSLILISLFLFGFFSFF